MTDKTKNLYYLADLSDYKVAADYSDVRGWEVIDANHRIIGKVFGLLVNKLAERVVYLDVEVDKSLIEDGYNTYQTSANNGVHGFLNRDGDDHLIIPIGMVCLDTENKKVLSNQITYNTFARARRFSKMDLIDPDYELVTYRNYLEEDALESIMMDDQFYNRKEFDNALRNLNSV